jgi:hypothetical protein
LTLLGYVVTEKPGPREHDPAPTNIRFIDLARPSGKVVILPIASHGSLGNIGVCASVEADGKTIASPGLLEHVFVGFTSDDQTAFDRDARAGTLKFENGSGQFDNDGDLLDYGENTPPAEDTGPMPASLNLIDFAPDGNASEFGMALPPLFVRVPTGKNVVYSLRLRTYRPAACSRTGDPVGDDGVETNRGPFFFAASP